MNDLIIFKTYINGEMEIDIAANDTRDLAIILDRLAVEASTTTKAFRALSDLLDEPDEKEV